MHAPQIPLSRILRTIAATSPLSGIPVRVRRGICSDARWTLFPYTSYWRGTTHPEIDNSIFKYGCRESTVAWDIGAHFGYYTVAMARSRGVRGLVPVPPPRSVVVELMVPPFAPRPTRNVESE